MLSCTLYIIRCSGKHLASAAAARQGLSEEEIEVVVDDLVAQLQGTKSKSAKAKK
jgi:hypothetical protein